MTTRDITFPAADGHPMRAAFAAPTDGRTHAGVIVIHEAFGLNDDIRRITGMVADLGYAALAPDLFDGPRARAICIVRTMLTLSRGENDAFKDLEAARSFLNLQPTVDATRTGVIGFCMGGGFALMYAVRAPLAAAAAFYGNVPKTVEQLKGVCPVLGGFGGQDRVCAPQGLRLEKLLTEMNVEHDVKIYPDAGHSFMSHHGGVVGVIGKYTPLKAGYDEAAANDSWKRIEAFFGKHLAR